MSWDIKQLQQFRTIYDMGNLSHAAAHMGMTQSALSKSLAKLEDKLGLQLFYRHTRELTPTSAGTELYLQAQQLLVSVTDFDHHVSLIQDGNLGQVNIGMGPLAEPLFARRLVRSLIDTAPDVRIKISSGNFDQLTQGLLNHEVDFLIYDVGDIKHSFDPARFHIEPLLKLPLIVVAHPQHEVFQEGVSPLDCKWSAPQMPPRYRDSLPEAFRETFVRRGIPQYQLEDFQQCLSLAKEGVTLTAAVESEVADDIKANRLKQVSMPFVAEANMGLYRLRTRQLSESAKSVVSVLTQLCKTHFKGQT